VKKRAIQPQRRPISLTDVELARIAGGYQKEPTSVETPNVGIDPPPPPS
jgi:hypothetical protein